MSESITLYAVPESTYCARVRLVLELKSIEYTEERPAGGSYKSEDYRRLVPAGSVPAININGRILHDSDAIVELLEDLFGEPKLRPADPLDRAILKSITRFHDTRLEPALRTLFPLVGHSEKFEDAKASIEMMNEHLDRLDVLVNPRPYLGGETLSLADCAYATTLFMMTDIANTMSLSPRVSQKISGWRNTLYATDVVRQIIDQNRAAIAAWITTKLN